MLPLKSNIFAATSVVEDKEINAAAIDERICGRVRIGREIILFTRIME